MQKNVGQIQQSLINHMKKQKMSKEISRDDLRETLKEVEEIIAMFIGKSVNKLTKIKNDK